MFPEHLIQDNLAVRQSLLKRDRFWGFFQGVEVEFTEAGINARPLRNSFGLGLSKFSLLLDAGTFLVRVNLLHKNPLTCPGFVKLLFNPYGDRLPDACFESIVASGECCGCGKGIQFTGT